MSETVFNVSGSSTLCEGALYRRFWSHVSTYLKTFFKRKRKIARKLRMGNTGPKTQQPNNLPAIPPPRPPLLFPNDSFPSSQPLTKTKTSNGSMLSNPNEGSPPPPRKYHSLPNINKHSSFNISAPLVSPVKNKDFTERLLVTRPTTEFYTSYEKESELGSGITGSVFLVLDLKRKEERAMKTINLSRVNRSQLRELKQEMNLLKSMDHPNVIRLIEVFEDRKSVMMIMDLCKGGNLVSSMGRIRLRTEFSVKTVVFQLLQAIKYIHEKGVVHRDIKLENVMFLSEDVKNLNVVLIDFGFSVLETGLSMFARRKRMFTTNCGTAFYMAPEVLKGNYGKECDMWSIGVLIFLLLTGSPPFNGSDTAQIYASISKGEVSFASPIWTKLSGHARILVENLLVLEPHKRWTPEQCLNSEWFQNYAHPAVSASKAGADLDLEANVVQSLAKFASYNHLKKTAMLVLAQHCTGKEISELRQLFLSLDADHSGTISFPELKNLLVQNGMKEEEAHKLFRDADVDASGGLQLTEFIAATMEATCTIDSQRLGEAFDHIAKGEEFIVNEHLQSLLGNSVQIKQMIRGADRNKDGKISREEFLQIVVEKQAKELIEPIQKIFPKLEKTASGL